MSILELLPLTLPAVVIIGVAIRLAIATSRRGDVVLDLRDVPSVRLATENAAAPAPANAPVRGALVEPGGTGTLGARMRSAAGPAHPPAAVPARNRTVVVRRRRRPLVAVSRESPTR